MNCINLSDYVLPNKIETIGFGAFSGCYNLQKIDFPESLHIVDLFYGHDFCNAQSVVFRGHDLEFEERFISKTEYVTDGKPYFVFANMHFKDIPRRLKRRCAIDFILSDVSVNDDIQSEYIAYIKRNKKELLEFALKHKNKKIKAFIEKMK
jgi:hypothetical protein